MSIANQTWFVLTRYAIGGIVAYATPRFLVAFGVPLDQWVIAMGTWLSVHLNEDAALWLAAIVVAAFLYALSFVLSRLSQAPTAVAPQGYLRDADSELGSAIRDMARHSAWGRWFAAQTLAASKLGISENLLMQTATHLVGNAITNGQIVVRGRKPGELDYKPITQTDWRSTALHMIPDEATHWRMILIPRGGAEISQDGTVKGHDQPSIERTNQLGDYDSLIVNSAEFEGLWPQKDKPTDIARHKFLKMAKKARADLIEIKKLSRE